MLIFFVHLVQNLTLLAFRLFDPFGKPSSFDIQNIHWLWLFVTWFGNSFSEVVNWVALLMRTSMAGNESSRKSFRLLGGLKLNFMGIFIVSRYTVICCRWRVNFPKLWFDSMRWNHYPPPPVKFWLGKEIFKASELSWLQSFERRHFLHTIEMQLRIDAEIFEIFRSQQL